MAASAADACTPPPPPVRDLAPPRFYADKVGSRVDTDLKQQHSDAVAPLKAFLAHVTADADRAVRQRSPSFATCALTWIAAWAKADAWLGHMGSKQGEYQRKWDLAGHALAYLKLRPYGTPHQRADIEPWLVRFADEVKSFQLGPDRKRNNHLYWLGLGLAATALSTGTPRLWDDARAIMREAVASIRNDGTLPLEMERGQRALHYHAFAVTPLVVMAELAARNGEDWYGLADGALHRLVSRTAAGLQAPETFDAMAGIAQERPIGAGAGWAWLYETRFPGRLPRPLPQVPRKHRWLGGDVSLLPQELP